ncbi:sortase domain-containing protein [Streptomyces fructofermentans]|uniref:Sortase n=1 Tax=Streptomyces fructofermentans TaxID=152141 RepID=A0A918KCW9_9ACTN|nr:sortase [Streptomyces fructofermentans]GGX57880.1 hypothetical protein GCM10010515_26980 [Streptomyces fructofermentans]
MIATRAAGAALAAGLLGLVAACAGGTPDTTSAPRAERSLTSPAPTGAPVASASASPSAEGDGSPSPEASSARTSPVPASDSSAPVKPAVDPRTTPASMSIPAIGVRDLKVVPYEGTTDDWPGTHIQNRGVAASPYGPQGGVGPGGTGNYLVTAHRLSAGGPLRDLPSLDKGDTVRVVLGDRVYTYEITASRWTSFRSERSLAEQRAAVPGKPGEKPTEAMITISTCATPEDNAAGNFWRDDRHNPEHRIDRIGTLVATEKAAGGAKG